MATPLSTITTTVTPAPAPFLPGNWSPPTSATCLRTSDYWLWDYGSTNDRRTVLGGPTQTTDCLPTSWNPELTYAGSACPSFYTQACPESHGVVTCCPWVYSFTCAAQNWAPGEHGSMFRCSSRYSDHGGVKVTRASMYNSITTTENRTRDTKHHLFALALMYTPLSATLSSTTSSSGLPAAGTPAGLSPAAAVGIGVGSAAVVLVFALLMWFIYRRRRANAGTTGIVAAAVTPTATKPSTETRAYTGPYMTEDASQNRVYSPISPRPREVAANYRYFELNGSAAHELS